MRKPKSYIYITLMVFVIANYIIGNFLPGIFSLLIIAAKLLVDILLTLRELEPKRMDIDELSKAIVNGIREVVDSEDE